MSYSLRHIRLSVTFVAALLLWQINVPSIAVPQPQSFWRAKIQEAIDADVKHDSRHAEALYKALIKRPMPLNDLMEAEARLATILIYQRRSDEANKYVDAIIKQSATLTDKNGADNAILAICLSDLAETLCFSVTNKREGAAWLARAVSLRRVFCRSNKAIVSDLKKLAHAQCACGDFQAADNTLTQLATALKEIDSKPKDFRERQTETTLIQAILEDKIAHDKHRQTTIDSLSADMSRTTTKAGYYAQLGAANAFVCNTAEARKYFQLSQQCINTHTQQGKIEQEKLLAFEAALPLEAADWNEAADLINKRIALLKELNGSQLELERAYGMLVLCYKQLHREADAQAASRARAQAIDAQKKDVDWMIEDERSAQQEEAKRQKQGQP